MRVTIEINKVGSENKGNKLNTGRKKKGTMGTKLNFKIRVN